MLKTWLSIFKRNYRLLFFIGLFFLIFGKTYQVFQGNYFVGGDDSQLYYLIPEKFLRNFSFNIVSANTLSGSPTYGQQLYTIPFFLLIALVKFLLPVNAQILLLSLNTFGAYLFFFLFARELFKTQNKDEILVHAGAFLYSFSPLLIFTSYQYLLFTVYLHSILPLLLYLFLLLLKTHKYFLLWGIVTIASIFSVVLLSVPWVIASLISLTPLLLYLFFTMPFNFFRKVILVVVSLILVNLYWLLFFIHAPLSSKGDQYLMEIVTSDFRVAAEQNINAVVQHNDFIYPFIGMFHHDLVITFNWSTLNILMNYYQPIYFAGFLLTIVIIGATILISTKNDYRKNLHMSLVLSWLVAIYFFTVNITPYGVSFFLKLNQYVPGFVMFRNMFDKFPFGVALTYSLVFISSALLIRTYLKKKSKADFLFVLAVILLSVIYASPFFISNWKMSVLNGTKNVNTTISGIDSNFENVSYTLNKSLYSRAIWLPLNNANYAIFPTEQNNHYYIGVSPLVLYTGQRDVSGLLNLNNQLKKQYSDAVKNQDLVSLASIFKQLGITHVIYYQPDNSEILSSYLYEESQNIESLVEKMSELVEFSNQYYTVYALNEEYSSSVLYFKNECGSLAITEYTPQKISFTVDSLSADSCSLILNEPYNHNWKITSETSSSESQSSNSLNSWVITDEGEYLIQFTPTRWITPAILFSVFSYIVFSILCALKDRNVK